MPQKKKLIAVIVYKFFIYLVLILAIISLVGSWYLLIGGRYKNYQRNQTVTGPQLAEKIRFLSQQAASEQKSAQVIFTPSENQLISLALPGNFDFPSVLIQLSALAQKNNLKIISLEKVELKNSAGAAPASGGLKRASLKIKLLAENYNNLKNFFNGLENSALVFDANSLMLAADSPEVSLNLITYYYAD